MRAVVQDEYGPTFRVAQVPVPAAGPNDVLVRVVAAGVDRGVWHVVYGKPYVMRAMGFGLRRPKTRIPGMDLAGVVEAVGSGVTRFAPGDNVFGTAMGAGAYAEYAALAENALTHKPDNLSFEQAAALPVSAMTALKGVRDVARVQAGQNVLVVGASGGVGGYAVQMARSLGAEVTGVASTGKLDLVREFGAAHVIDYTREDIADGGPRFDVILDIGGNRTLSHLRAALKPRGTLVIVGGEGGGDWFGGIDRQLRAMLLSLFTSQTLTSYVSTANQADLLRVAELAGRGDLRPEVDRTFELHEARDAIEYLAQGRARGKVVIAIAPVMR